MWAKKRKQKFKAISLKMFLQFLLSKILRFPHFFRKTCTKESRHESKNIQKYLLGCFSKNNTYLCRRGQKLLNSFITVFPNFFVVVGKISAKIHCLCNLRNCKNLLLPWLWSNSFSFWVIPHQNVRLTQFCLTFFEHNCTSASEYVTISNCQLFSGRWDFAYQKVFKYWRWCSFPLYK